MPDNDPDAGPDHAPPSVPTGWIAQWDANSRKYYFVQISTGVSTWEVPTKAAPTVPTPGSTPVPPNNPYPMPDESYNGHGGDGTRGVGGEGERGFGNMAMNALLGGGNKPQGGQQSGLGGIASSLLGGGSSSHGNQGHGSSGGGLGQLAGSLLGGGSNKPNQGGSSSGSKPSSGGGLLGGLFGGHGQSHQNYGYSHNTNQSGTYNGAPPPNSYQEAFNSGQHVDTANSRMTSNNTMSEDMVSRIASNTASRAAMEDTSPRLSPTTPMANTSLNTRVVHTKAANTNSPKEVSTRPSMTRTVNTSKAVMADTLVNNNMVGHTPTSTASSSSTEEGNTAARTREATISTVRVATPGNRRMANRLTVKASMASTVATVAARSGNEPRA
ncbi:hypothetical protein K461DRAFT_291047 [Myriangium duriaei CBS 260.36]|uniref:WW domain-containing protein n=1 Tax=Myriangium duriaei CBS 260.36 TaxID=1168546 RepID=A0A9P4JC20_9PEZI|nr:hypothetical protein K461DRAFT_291047 [Myriangium duriaei CBS 260.36]